MLVLYFAQPLGLDDGQVEKIRRDMFETERRLVDKETQLRLSRLKVQQLSSSAKPDTKAISRQIDKIADAAAELAKLHAALWQRTRDTLSPEQRDAFGELRSGRGRGWGGPGPRGWWSWW